MSRLGCLALCLAFLLAMTITQSFAMDDPGNRKVRIPGSDVWIPASHLIPFEKKARYDFTPLLEEPSLYQPVEAGEASTRNSRSDYITSRSDPSTPDPSPSTQDGHPLPNQWPSESRARQGASGVTGPSSSRGWPVVQESPSGLLSSLKPDQFRFRNVEYPLNSAELAHLYGDDGSTPVNFALLSQGASEDGRKFLLEVGSPVKFYPEPSILNRLQRAIVDKLQELKISLGEHDGSNRQFLNGKFLLPPLEQTEDGFQMPENARFRLSEIPTNRVIRKSAKTPANIYKLVLAKEGDEEDARYILATTASPGVYTDMIRSRHGAPTDSHFWLFFEGRAPQHRRRQSLVLLGGMNIPRRAREKFESVGFITRFERALPRPTV